MRIGCNTQFAMCTPCLGETAIKILPTIGLILSNITLERQLTLALGTDQARAVPMSSGHGLITLLLLIDIIIIIHCNRLLLNATATITIGR